MEIPDFIQATNPTKLASMLAIAPDADGFWRPEDLEAALAHQLAAPLLVDLCSVTGTGEAEIRALARSAQPPVGRFGDVLFHPAPPMPLLRLVKDFAKAMRSNPEKPIPPEVAAALYFASIVAANVRLGRSISDLPDGELRSGIQWLLAKPWIDARSRALLREGAEILAARPGT